ncbi:MAG: hypothetical protein Q8N53_08140 [Longimicrobiales bacterium]|nr:hypothetical protein [Longimicrobiales bacterium]
MRRTWTLALALYLLAVLPDVGHACAVCFDPREENRLAFLATAIFMSLVPLGMVGGLGLWLRKRAREIKGLPPEE